MTDREGDTLRPVRKFLDLIVDVSARHADREPRAPEPSEDDDSEIVGYSGLYSPVRRRRDVP